MAHNSQDQTYFMKITLNYFVPSTELVISINKNEKLTVSIIKKSFHFQQDILSSLDYPIKPIIYKQKISFSGKTLSYFIKSSEINQNFTYFLKITKIKYFIKEQLCSFQINFLKYKQAFQFKQIKYFQEELSSNQSSFLIQVYVETNQAKLEYLLTDIRSMKYRKISESREKTNKNKNNHQDCQNFLQLENPSEKINFNYHNRSRSKKTIDLFQNISVTSKNIKNKDCPEQIQSYKLIDDNYFLENLLKSDKQNLDKRSLKRSQRQIKYFVKKQPNLAFTHLEMSPIQQVLNSKDQSEQSNTNKNTKIQQSSSKQQTEQKKQSQSFMVEKQPDRVLQAGDQLEHKFSQISSICQQNPQLHYDLQIKKHQSDQSADKNYQQKTVSDIIPHQTNTSYSRSVLAHQTNLEHSSQIYSQSQQIKQMKQKRNKIICFFVIILTLLAFVHLMTPNKKVKNTPSFKFKDVSKLIIKHKNKPLKYFQNVQR